MKEGGDELRTALAAADALEGRAGDVAEFPDVLGAEVGQFVFFPVSPQILDRVEFRGVGGKPLDVQPFGLRLQVLGDDFAAVDRSSVPEQQDLAGELTVQGRQELDDLGTSDRASVQLEVEVVQRETGDRRDVLPIEVERQDRGLAAGRPSASAMWPLA